jgi:hypothetical protein
MASSNLPGKIFRSWRLKVPELVLFSIKNFQFQMAENKRLFDFLHTFLHKMVSQCLRKDLRKEIIFFGSTTFSWPHHKFRTGKNLNFEKTVKIKIAIFALLAGFCVEFSDFSSISDISGHLACVWKQIPKSQLTSQNKFIKKSNKKIFRWIQSGIFRRSIKLSL